jgi:iron complex transport system substrate-binding protein
VLEGSKIAFAAVLVLALGVAIFLGSGSGLHPALLGGSELLPTRIEGEGFPKQLIDPLGVSRPMERPPTRVVSTVLAADELLSALVDPARVAGVTYLADDATQSLAAGAFPASVARVGVEVEPLLALEPDLVFVATYTRAETVRLLLSVGVPVLRLGGVRSFDEVTENLRVTAAALGEEARAEAIRVEMVQRIQEVERRVAGRERPRVLVWERSGYTKGSETLMDEIIQRAGGVNVIRETGLSGAVRIAVEFAIGLEPEVILVEGGNGGVDDEAVRALLEDPVWRHVPAVRAGRVYPHAGPWISSLTHYRVRDLEEVARALHPGVFEP